MGYKLDKVDEVINEVMKDYKPFIEYIGDGLYQINAGRYSCICSKAGAMEFDKALKQKAEEYVKNIK
jgi:hypothetical protein